MDRGYGVEGTSDTLYVRLNDQNEIEESTLLGMHFAREDEFELEYNITLDEFKSILSIYI